MTALAYFSGSHAVLDASVVARIFLPDESSSAIDDFFHSSVIKYAPSVLHLEIMSLLVKAYRNRRINKDSALAAFKDWNSFLKDGVMELTAQEDYSEHAFSLACELKHSFYDCCYLALAQSYNCPLITADKQLYERGITGYSNIILINES